MTNGCRYYKSDKPDLKCCGTCDRYSMVDSRCRIEAVVISTPQVEWNGT